MKEIEDTDSLIAVLEKGKMKDVAIQSLDIRPYEDIILNIEIENCIFLGCEMTERTFLKLHEKNHVFPQLDVPFNIYPNKLYNYKSLYEGFDNENPESYNNTPDKIIYDYYNQKGKDTIDIKERLARRLHDHSISDALYDFISEYKEYELVGIMGGHDVKRNDPLYFEVVALSKELTEKGCLMVSGGGPGAMEATHLGAWLAGKGQKELKDAIEILSHAPSYKDRNWLSTAFQVLHKYPDCKYKSLGIPTWLYGHEPPTPFATHIAKYFDNSVREEGLLAIAKGGIVFTPGSAGTLQEIFQELAQNHYETYGYASPMIFLNKAYWSYERPVYPMIELMKHRGNLNHLDIALYDNKREVMNHIMGFINDKNTQFSQ